MLICEAENYSSNKDFQINIYNEKSINTTLESLTTNTINRAYKDIMSNLATITGKRNFLVTNCNNILQDNNNRVMRYDFVSMKLGIGLFYYVNDSKDKLAISTQFKIDGQYDCDINLGDRIKDRSTKENKDSEDKGCVTLCMEPSSKKSVCFKGLDEFY